MSRKALGVLIIVASILVALAFVGQGRNSAGSIAGDSAGTLLMPALTDAINNIERVSVDGAGNNRLVTLARVDDGWTVTEAGGYPAERSEVNTLLIALAEARVVEEKTADPGFHSMLGVENINTTDATGIEVALETSDGDRFEVVLGATYGSGQIYARIGLENQSVLIDRNPDISRDPADWVVTEIIAIANDRVQRVEIAHADDDRLEIRKETRDSEDFSVDDVPAGRDLQYAGVASVTADLLQGLQLDAVERRREVQTAPTVVSEFWMFDGLVISVTVAGENEDAWLSFSARFDVEQALAFASESVNAELAVADQLAEESSEEGAVQARRDDSIAEAEAISQRLADWQYQIPSFQLSQLTRRMEDLLLPETDE